MTTVEINPDPIARAFMERMAQKSDRFQGVPKPPTVESVKVEPAPPEPLIMDYQTIEYNGQSIAVPESFTQTTSAWYQHHIRGAVLKGEPLSKVRSKDKMLFKPEYAAPVMRSGMLFEPQPETELTVKEKELLSTVMLLGSLGATALLALSQAFK
jgi:hypothetical protein